MVRAFFLSILSLLCSVSLFGQILNPVKWTVELKHDNKENYILVAHATIQDGWWVYSQFLSTDTGPRATSINYDAGTHYKLSGKAKESNNAKKVYDQFFEMDVTKFEHHYTIEQKIKVTDPSLPIKGYLEYQTCNDDRCLPPTDVEFEFFAKAASTGAADKKADSKKITETPADKKAQEIAKATEEKKKTPVVKEKVAEKPAPSFSDVNAKPKMPSGENGILHPVKWTFRSEKKS